MLLALFAMVANVGRGPTPTGETVFQVTFSAAVEPVVPPQRMPRPVTKPKPKPKPKIKSKPKPAPLPKPRHEPEPVRSSDPPPSDASAASLESAQPEPPLIQSKSVPAPSPPTPVAVPIYKLSALPQFVYRAPMLYPPEMRDLGLEATVKLEVFINRDGEVLEIKVIESGGAQFDQAAIAGIRSSRFKPGEVDGQSVPVRYRIPINFRLR